MLTPVDIHQKKFHIGIGYDKKDVNSFFEEVVESYEQLYRSNAELKEKVITLTDTLQNYKSKEASLQKSLMLAEKDSEDTKSKANKEAKTIELEAKNKAKNIIGDAEERLEAIKEEMSKLETQYAAYKSNFLNLMKMQYSMLESDDFDANAKIDERALTLLGGSISVSPNKDTSFGSFDGDPQLRDESSLGGMANSSSGMSTNPDDKLSTSAVYTSNLGANENFVDPFNPNKKEEPGRYNPYDGRQPSKTKGSKSSFTVNTNPGSAPRSRKPQPKPQEKAQTESADTPKVEPEKTVPKTEEATTNKTEEKTTRIPTVDFDFETEKSESFSGDVEVSSDGKALPADDNSDGKTDDDGFEFV